MRQDIAIHTPYITLGNVLKLAGVISAGGQARAFLLSSRVKVNGLFEDRRGRKLYPGDRVEVAGRLLAISHGDPPN